VACAEGITAKKVTECRGEKKTRPSKDQMIARSNRHGPITQRKKEHKEGIPYSSSKKKKKKGADFNVSRGGKKQRE